MSDRYAYECSEFGGSSSKDGWFTDDASWWGKEMKLMRNRIGSQVNLLNKYCLRWNTRKACNEISSGVWNTDTRVWLCILPVTAAYRSHKYGTGCKREHTGWGDAFSGAIKHPCASAYKLSAKSDSTGILGGEEAEWINPVLCVRAVWLLLQPGLLGLLKLIYKASVYSGFPRKGKVNSNGPLDGNKSQHGCKAHTDFSQQPFMASKIQIHPYNPNFRCTPTHSSIYPLNQAI